MSTDRDGAITAWISGLRQGDSVAEQEIWNHYFAKLAAVAQSRLRTMSRKASGEDVALSAIKSVMLGVRENRFPDITDRTNLWPLLVTITARKAISEQRRQLAAKRAVTAEEALADWHALAASEPSPEFAVELTDQIDRLVGKFEQPELRTIARRKLEGWTNDEIAAELGCTKRTVIRKLNRIRQEWETSEIKAPEGGDKD